MAISGFWKFISGGIFETFVFGDCILGDFSLTEYCADKKKPIKGNLCSEEFFDILKVS